MKNNQNLIDIVLYGNAKIKFEIKSTKIKIR